LVHLGALWDFEGEILSSCELFCVCEQGNIHVKAKENEGKGTGKVLCKEEGKGTGEVLCGQEVVASKSGLTLVSWLSPLHVLHGSPPQRSGYMASMRTSFVQSSDSFG
jgi:hypothetical protein